MTTELHEALHKLNSLLGKKKARKTLIKHLNQYPETTLKTIEEEYEYLKRENQQTLIRILAEQARQNPRLAALLYQKHKQGKTWATTALQYIGVDPNRIDNLLQQLRDLQEQLQTQAIKRYLKNMIENVKEKIRLGRLGEAQTLLQQLASQKESIKRVDQNLQQLKRLSEQVQEDKIREITIGETERIIEQLISGHLQQALGKASELVESVREVIEYEKTLKKMGNIEPQGTLEKLKNMIIHEYREKKESATTIQQIKKTLQETVENLQSLNELNKLLQTLTPELADYIITRTKTPREALEKAKETQKTLQTLKHLTSQGITPLQLTQYLQSIKQKYGQQIHHKTLQTLQNTNINIALLKQEIEALKPPYKSYQKQLKQKLKQSQPRLVQLWQSKDLGDRVKSVSWSSDGDQLAAGSSWRDSSGKYHGRVIVYDSSGNMLWQKEIGEPVYSVSWSPQGDKLAAGTGVSDKIVVFDNSGNMLWQSEDLGGWVESIAWSPDGDKLAAGLGFPDEKIVVFDSDGNILWQKDLDDWVESVSWSPTGDKLAVGIRALNKVIVFDGSGNRLWQIEDLKAYVRSVAWSPDGSKLAVGGDFDKVIVYDSSGNMLWQSEDLGDRVWSVSWSPSGDKLAAGLENGTVVVFDSSGNQIWRSENLGGNVLSVTWSPQGGRLAVGGSFGKVIVYGLSGCGFGGLSGLSGFLSVGDGVCGFLARAVTGGCEDATDGVPVVVEDFGGFVCEGDLEGALAVYNFVWDLEECPGCEHKWDMYELLLLAPRGLVERVKGLLDRAGFSGGLVDDYIYGRLLEGGSYGSVRLGVEGFLERAAGVLERYIEALGSERGGLLREFIGTAQWDGLESLVGVLEHALEYVREPEEYLGSHLVVEGGRVCNRSVAPLIVAGEGFVGQLRPGECASAGGMIHVEGPGRVKTRIGPVAPGPFVVSPKSSWDKRTVGDEPVGVEKPTVDTGGGESGSVVGLFIGRVLRLRFRPEKPRLLSSSFRVGGFEVRSIIGGGGFAVTLLGVDEYGRSVVVKIPRAVYESVVYGIPVHHVDTRRFLRELEILRGLDHPHIIELISGGVDRERNIPYLVFEYAENGSLRGVLVEMGRLPLPDALTIGVQVADALAYLHGKGIVHRDVKPENILFTREGILKLADFNISKIMRSTVRTSLGARSYTIGYASPEQIHPTLGKTGPWSDVWSLGVVLVELITGRLPFPEEEYEEAIVHDEPDLAGMPDSLARLIAEMLSRKPGDRPGMTRIRNILATILQEVLH